MKKKSAVNQERPDLRILASVAISLVGSLEKEIEDADRKWKVMIQSYKVEIKALKTRVAAFEKPYKLTHKAPNKPGLWLRESNCKNKAVFLERIERNEEKGLIFYRGGEVFVVKKLRNRWGSAPLPIGEK